MPNSFNSLQKSANPISTIIETMQVHGTSTVGDTHIELGALPAKSLAFLLHRGIVAHLSEGRKTGTNPAELINLLKMGFTTKTEYKSKTPPEAFDFAGFKQYLLNRDSRNGQFIANLEAAYPDNLDKLDFLKRNNSELLNQFLALNTIY